MQLVSACACRSMKLAYCLSVRLGYQAGRKRMWQDDLDSGGFTGSRWNVLLNPTRSKVQKKVFH